MSRLLIVAAALFAFGFSAAPAEAGHHHKSGVSASTLTTKKSTPKKHLGKTKHYKSTKGGHKK
ncbi:MAG TPA: hypothetical protein VG269_15615 [Tepidisphaeraceae bacterium]|jgi:hypothetical protein|nr:hypothetical protein [Tepidisphaeraceae bacterium]